jgi:hypothetical protein
MTIEDHKWGNAVGEMDFVCLQQQSAGPMIQSSRAQNCMKDENLGWKQPIPLSHALHDSF